MLLSFIRRVKRYLGTVTLLIVLFILSFLGKPETTLAAPACTVPDSGNWNINSDCDLVQSEIAPRNVAVRNGATLRIPNGRALNIDFSNFNLRLANDSRVLVEKGGKIQSSQLNSPGGGNSGSTEDTAELPDPPAWIQLSDSPYLIVDFGITINGNPRITLPIDFLPDYLPNKEGTLVIPDNFCGFNVRKADAFYWQTQNGQVVTDFPYNAVEDVSDLASNEFNGGINFTGPIGQCANTNDPWQFFQPITQTGGDSPIPNLQLIIQMRQESEIEFLNFNFHVGVPLIAYELFSDKVFEKIKSIAKLFESTEIDNGYCGIDAYVKKVCEDEKNGEAPIGSCPVSDSFSSPC